MTLLSGDLTTPARVALWLPNVPSPTPPVIPMLISAQTNLIYSKLNRARLYSQQFVRTLDGVGNYQLVLPDYPVTAVSAVQVGPVAINPYPLPNPTTGLPISTFGYGWRCVLWAGDLPSQNAVLEFVNGTFWQGAQNVQVTYQAGYVEQNEPWTLPATGGFSSGVATITVLQPQGIWCRDNGVTYAATGVALTPVTAITAAGQYIPPTDTTLGAYTFGVADANTAVLISYSFVPSDLELACIQMVAESYSYRNRIGELDKVLGGQETVRFMRGGNPRQMFSDIPPEVEALIWPYVSVVPPAIGAPI